MEKEYLKDKIGIDAVLYGVYAALIPLNMIMNYTGSTVNKKIGIIAALLMLISIILNNRMSQIKDVNFSMMFFVIYSAFSILWSTYYTTSKTAVITLLSLYITFAVGRIRKFNKSELSVIFIIMTLVSMVIPFYLGLNLATSYSRLTLSNENGSADQNGLACNMSFVAIIAFSNFIENSKGFFKYYYAVAFGLISIGIILTGSRTAIIGMIISLLFYLLKSFPELKKKKSFKKTVLIIVAALIVGFNYLSKNLSQSILNRLSFTGIKQDAGSGRLEIWKNILNIFLNDPFHFIFGYGFGTQAEIYFINYGYYSATHNVFLQLLLEIGIIGTIFFFFSIINLWKYSSAKQSYLSNTLCLMLLFTYMTLTFTTNKGGWNTILLAYSISELKVINIESENKIRKET